MQIDQGLLQIALIFIPGLLWASIEKKYASKGMLSITWFVMRTFLFGVLSYAILIAIFLMFGIQSDLVTSSATQSDVIPNVHLQDAILATVVSFPSSILWLYIQNYKILTKLLQAIGATKTFGEEDLWDYIFNSANKGVVEYVHVRDFDKELVYSGWVMLFSETDKLRELHLKNVEVSDFSGNTLYEMPWVYLAREPYDVTIEFPRRNG
ncbi:MAG: hypothetical protein CMM78_01295 [Rhodospirillaceae bacterium]|jgi:hypothetical protein|uniref:hypothetical protein n=1 Tax=Hwanghaeella sp. 1Z406 TaxID=3402811 RepID=UPI000C5F9014|nr:hypothetical protein [Rhodospirillales bacterium]MAX46818.1 hypothetical protein [Rhodospirillaceae bacterium]|tara:strand:- start:1143 stop:1769 length:627 start_codon:yes stop_codon:yes gene_type:complete